MVNLQEVAKTCTLALAQPLCFAAVGSLLLCALVAASPLGAVRLGGEEAKPDLSLWQYFSIALCTTVAVGILFWATAEPLFHFQEPPVSLGIEPQSAEAKIFAMSTLLHHWTLLPYSMYGVPAVLFALAFYNLGRPFRLSSCLYPLLGKASLGPIGTLVDTVCLFALVAGMSASLGAGILSLGGGLQQLLGITGGNWLKILIGLTVVASFVLSAVSGLNRGVRILSDLNTKMFFLIMLLIAFLGPAGERCALTLWGLGDFLINLIPRGLLLPFQDKDPWVLAWPLFSWTNWLAWAPMTALFLGRISKGYTVRQMLLFTLVLPSVFVTIWMGILAGTTLELQTQSGHLLQKLEQNGPESVVYAIFETMPLSGLLTLLFVLGVFISYVTAADSNTLSMAGLCWSGVSVEDPEPPAQLKILWGCIVGGLAVTMVCSAGVEGVKSLSNLGGIPALFFQMACSASLLLLMLRWKRFQG